MIMLIKSVIQINIFFSVMVVGIFLFYPNSITAFGKPNMEVNYIK